MRRFLAALSSGVLIALAATSIASAGGDPFTRSWSAIDFDGSVMTLTFTGTGDTRTVSFVDTRAAGCHGDQYRLDGTGAITGNDFVAQMTGGCAGDDPTTSGDPAIFAYDPASDTLSFGEVTWHRGNWARDAFLGVWHATDVDGSTLKLTFRGSGLTRLVSFMDDLATSCIPDAVLRAVGTGVIEPVLGVGRYITVSLEGGCVDGASVEFPDLMYKYQVETDTLLGPLGLGGGELYGTLTWHRG